VISHELDRARDCHSPVRRTPVRLTSDVFEVGCPESLGGASNWHYIYWLALHQLSDADKLDRGWRMAWCMSRKAWLILRGRPSILKAALATMYEPTLRNAYTPASHMASAQLLHWSKMNFWTACYCPYLRLFLFLSCCWTLQQIDRKDDGADVGTIFQVGHAFLSVACAVLMESMAPHTLAPHMQPLCGMCGDKDMCECRWIWRNSNAPSTTRWPMD